MTRSAPRMTPYARGQLAARQPKPTLKGLPYGLGPRQDDFIRGFQDQLLQLQHAANRRKEAA
jgi:hypothetical protein